MSQGSQVAMDGMVGGGCDDGFEERRGDWETVLLCDMCILLREIFIGVARFSARRYVVRLTERFGERRC